MPLSVRCPACGHWFDPPDDAAGRTAPCPACGAAAFIPPPLAEAAEEEAPFSFAPPDGFTDADAPSGDRGVPAPDQLRGVAAGLALAAPAYIVFLVAPVLETFVTWAMWQAVGWMRVGPWSPSAWTCRQSSLRS